MEGKKIKWQGDPGMSRYGDAGPPIQHSETIKITIDELKTLIEENDIKPDKLFSKEEILADPKVKEKIDQLMKLEEEKIKEEEDGMIPGDDKPKTLTPEQQRQLDIDNELIPDSGKPGDDNDLIPD